MTELADLIDRHAPTEGVNETGVDGLVLARMTQPMARRPVVYGPSVCVVAQGEKHAHLGSRRIVYDANRYLVCSLTLPVDSEIPRASPEDPFLGIVLKIDTQLVGKLLLEMEDHVEWGESDVEGSIMSGSLHDDLGLTVQRLIETLDDPLDKKVLAPSLIRETIYGVLRGPLGFILRDCVLRDSSAARVAKIVRFLEDNFEQPLDVEQVARHANMSASALHHHFKRATSMSPMQFVKKLRLHRARTMLLAGTSAGEAAYAVGYGSPSQFSREFRRMFGVPPTGVARV